MTALDWIALISLGALLGTLGQGLRVVIGLKKLFDQTSEAGIAMDAAFSWLRFSISLIFGAVAGSLASIAFVGTATFTTTEVMSIIAAGYAGTDFIEGLIQKYKPA